MRAMQGVPASRVSSTMTKRNPRPRKYASASERQAAYRARAPEVCFRAESKTVDKLDEIAKAVDVSRADLLLSMTKFALTNHDWARFGLTHRPLPYQYGIDDTRKANPIMPTIYSVKSDYLLKDADEIERSAKESLKAWTLLGQTEKYSEAMKVVRALRDAAETRSLYTRREILRNAGFSIKSPKQTAKDIQGQNRKANPMKKPTPAQLAARARFAEMARSGAFKRRAKRKKNPEGVGFEGYDPYASRDRLDEYRQLTDAQLRYIIKDAGEAAKAQRGMRSEAKYLDQVNDAATVLYERKRKKNPAKKTVSQKISQLMHEGYPQKQAVAVALSEQRKGKVKGNPATGRKGSRTKLNPVPAKRQRMLNISWVTPGGEREMRSVPIEFTFTHYVGNVAEKFFVRNEGGHLIVSEYTTGGKVGQVPYSMRAAALNDRAAAKQFLGEMLSRIGADRFRAAVSKFSPIN